MFTKIFTRLIPALVLSALAATSQAATISFSGTVGGGTGAFEALFPVGLEVEGNLNFDTQLNAAQIFIGDICVTGDVSGIPPISPSCGASILPILVTGQTIYNGSPAPDGSTFEQAGTTFDGTSGVLEITAFSVPFYAAIPITLNFAADGTGTMFMTGTSLGTSTGDFTWAASAVPVPAASWLFGSALVGLAGLVRKR